MNTNEIIDFCAKVVDKTTKRYPVIPSHYFLCSDGQFRSVRGIPYGVTIVSPEQKLTYYVYWDAHSNTSFAMQRYSTEKEALEVQDARIAINVQEFREELNTLNETELLAQYTYWKEVEEKSTKST